MTNNQNQMMQMHRVCDFVCLVGETTTQIVVDNTFQITEGAIKVEHIEASIKDISFEVLNGKVLFNGTLHKQIFYVNRDNFVRHQAEDVPFSGYVVIPGAKEGMTAQVTAAIKDVHFELGTRSRLTQHVLIDVTVRVTEIITLPVPLLGCIEGQVVLGGTAQANAVVAVLDNMSRLIAFTFTNSNGFYRIVSLPPGNYRVVAAASGNIEMISVTVMPEDETCAVANFFTAPMPITPCPPNIPATICTLVSGLLDLVT